MAEAPMKNYVSAHKTKAKGKAAAAKLKKKMASKSSKKKLAGY